MIPALLPGVALTSTCVLLHYKVLRHLNDHLPKAHFLGDRPKVLIALFGLAFFALHHAFGLGMLGGEISDRYGS